MRNRITVSAGTVAVGSRAISGIDSIDNPDCLVAFWDLTLQLAVTLALSWMHINMTWSNRDCNH